MWHWNINCLSLNWSSVSAIWETEDQFQYLAFQRQKANDSCPSEWIVQSCFFLSPFPWCKLYCDLWYKVLAIIQMALGVIKHFPYIQSPPLWCQQSLLPESKTPWKVTGSLQRFLCRPKIHCLFLFVITSSGDKVARAGTNRWRGSTHPM